MSNFITLSIFSKHKLFQILEYQQASLDNKHWQIEEPSQVRISKTLVLAVVLFEVPTAFITTSEHPVFYSISWQFKVGMSP